MKQESAPVLVFCWYCWQPSLWSSKGVTFLAAATGEDGSVSRSCECCLGSNIKNQRAVSKKEKTAQKVTLKKKKIHCKNPFYQNIQRVVVCERREDKELSTSFPACRHREGGICMQGNVYTGSVFEAGKMQRWSRKPVSHVESENNLDWREPFQFSSPLMSSVGWWSPTQVELSLPLISPTLLEPHGKPFLLPCIPCISCLLFSYCACPRRIWLLLCTPSLGG